MWTNWAAATPRLFASPLATNALSLALRLRLLIGKLMKNGVPRKLNSERYQQESSRRGFVLMAGRGKTI